MTKTWLTSRLVAPFPHCNHWLFPFCELIQKNTHKYRYTYIHTYTHIHTHTQCQKYCLTRSDWMRRQRSAKGCSQSGPTRWPQLQPSPGRRCTGCSCWQQHSAAETCKTQQMLSVTGLHDKAWGSRLQADRTAYLPRWSFTSISAAQPSSRLRQSMFLSTGEEKVSTCCIWRNKKKKNLEGHKTTLHEKYVLTYNCIHRY